MRSETQPDNSVHYNWRQLLKLDAADASLVVEFVIKNNNTKAIVFIDQVLTEKLMNVNKKKVTIFVDGTFATVPQLKNTNCQLWTIVMRHNDRTFPIVYAIMEGRKTENYVDILRTIVNIIKIEPDTAICDFEKAEHKALKIVFPYVKIIGCFFHYSQALVQNADKRGILKGREKELGWPATKLLICLAYLPKELIVEGFHLIENVIFEDCKMLQPFFSYYKETWINDFKPNSFCIFNETHKTNNISERHNRELKAQLQKHSTIVEFLCTL
ncbi:uncharacterized protein LOC143902104 [Temnothorax americanus]|uniref:uncharacterized protein LOC143902104 n=1 Tax=Temnothorax americanus TaxID=1964332 RepID=UPI004068D44C